MSNAAFPLNRSYSNNDTQENESSNQSAELYQIYNNIISLSQSRGVEGPLSRAQRILNEAQGTRENLQIDSKIKHLKEISKKGSNPLIGAMVSKLNSDFKRSQIEQKVTTALSILNGAQSNANQLNQQISGIQVEQGNLNIYNNCKSQLSNILITIQTLTNRLNQLKVSNLLSRKELNSLLSENGLAGQAGSIAKKAIRNAIKDFLIANPEIWVPILIIIIVIGIVIGATLYIAAEYNVPDFATQAIIDHFPSTMDSMNNPQPVSNH